MVIASCSAVDVYIPSTNEQGVMFSPSESGIYRFTITGGSFNPIYPYDDPTSYWASSIHIFNNTPPRWIYYPETQTWGPEDFDFYLGNGIMYDSSSAAAAAGIGQSVDIPLDAGKYVNLLLPDTQGQYSENQGGMTVSIIKLPPPVRAPAALPVSTVYIPGTDVQGVIFSPSESGIYRFTITGGAFSQWPDDDDPRSFWASAIYIFNNSPPRWVYAPKDGHYVLDGEYYVGAAGLYHASSSAAEAAGVGQIVDIPIDAGNYVSMLVPDYQDRYSENRGGMTVSIVKLPSPAATTRALPASTVYIPGTDVQGVIFSPSESGIYRFTIASGAFSPHPTDDEDSYWASSIHIFNNSPPRWVYYPETQTWGPEDFDFYLGNGIMYGSSSAAAAAGIGQSVDIPLDAGKYVTMLLPGSQSQYATHRGGITVSIVKLPYPVVTTRALPAPGSVPLTISPVSPAPSNEALPAPGPVPSTTPPAGQTPDTGSGDSGYYRAVIIFLVALLCIVGVSSLYLMQKKHSGEVPEPAGKALFRRSSSDTDAGTARNIRSPLTGNGSAHHDIFISFSHEDKAVADAICATLESSMIRCWIAPRDVLPGEDYPAAIINAIEQCRIMILVYSSNSNNSDHVTRELSKAVSSGVIIIPFRIEDIPLSKNMEYLVGVPHWLDALTPPLEHHIERLLQTVKVLLTKIKKE
jgi:hypothetical protein